MIDCENQLNEIMEAYNREEKSVGMQLAVEVEPLKNFYKAEEYHQKYLVKNPGGYCHIPKEMFKLNSQVKNSPTGNLE